MWKLLTKSRAEKGVILELHTLGTLYMILAFGRIACDPFLYSTICSEHRKKSILSCAGVIWMLFHMRLARGPWELWGILSENYMLLPTQGSDKTVSLPVLPSALTAWPINRLHWICYFTEWPELGPSRFLGWLLHTTGFAWGKIKTNTRIIRFGCWMA